MPILYYETYLSVKPAYNNFNQKLEAIPFLPL